MNIDVDQQSHKDGATSSIQHLVEHEAVQSEVKGLGHVCGAGVHLTAILDEVVNSLQCSPGTHDSGAARLVSKLQLI